MGKSIIPLEEVRKWEGKIFRQVCEQRQQEAMAYLEELEEALAIDPPLDRIMLDNMSPATMREAVRLTAGCVPLEASGGVTLETVAEIAAAGVDYISVGALTHSVSALDISLDIS